MYWMPEELFHNAKLLQQFLDAVPQDTAVYQADIPGTMKKQIIVEKPKGFQNLNYGESQYELETQLKEMDEAGVQQSILKLPGCQEWLTLDLCKVFNDGLASQVGKSNGRLHALATIPPVATSEVLEELDRCVHQLGFVGVQLSSHYGESYLDDPKFRPLLKHIHDLQVPVYVHHTPLPVQYDSLLDYDNLRRSYGRCADQITAVTRELFSGLFEELPNLKIVHSMLGGGFFTYYHLMLPKRPSRKETLGRFVVETEDAYRYLANNIYFEMSHAAPWGKEQLECAIRVFGASQVIFGSSYPVRRDWLLDGPSFIQDLEISEEDKNMVLGKNAQRVYGL
jgi:hypothetical protein